MQNYNIKSFAKDSNLKRTYNYFFRKLHTILGIICWLIWYFSKLDILFISKFIPCKWSKYFKNTEYNNAMLNANFFLF